MRLPRIPSLLLGIVFVVVGGAYLLGTGPTGPTALILLLVGLGSAGLLALILRDAAAPASDTPPESTRPPDA